ncbi:MULTISPECIES: GcrA family cell cycle regulator [Hyphomonas]|jgi:GcrA cell cycle regulator|uniref:GcrA cell cycle regulator n=1 Tax=Hyphomonas atlantica TaxID=1280948 RepID=A0A059DYE4_9PROT|nr:MULTISPECIES: GcrA family cell cycle regulator [Hyphomonas]OUX87545.1 MAG: GcrA cell cycle regulator [Hyphomonas sp. TMED31]KCZ58562.1 GcrA cell cycle regulator [Hyphomonas atlantica]MAH92698.1 GcrA cell cycle regulator [Hyphomonas sp.]HAE95416.1 GcrA cell cycle regulator [Hyphomonas atlantica]HBH45322.1 GcrA cell cycle regulator [Hyphomonas atlantica]|tara:strand:+ start:428 stop:955 length:528 start_codon:yes stop_codon:yes gene_type:complete
MSWTEERVSVLKKLWAEGHSASQIAKQLGGVTRNAVIGKVHRLGLSGRATPSRPVKRPPRLARPKPRVLPDGSVKVAAPAAPETPEVRPAAERTEVMAPLPPLQQADGEPASILTLRDSMCKWPIGDPADPKFAFCGRKADCGPYCSEHAKVAFQPARKRESRKGAYDYVRRIAG